MDGYIFPDFNDYAGAVDTQYMNIKIKINTLRANRDALNAQIDALNLELQKVCSHDWGGRQRIYDHVHGRVTHATCQKCGRTNIFLEDGTPLYGGPDRL